MPQIGKEEKINSMDEINRPSSDWNRASSIESILPLPPSSVRRINKYSFDNRVDPTPPSETGGNKGNDARSLAVRLTHDRSIIII